MIGILTFLLGLILGAAYIFSKRGEIFTKEVITQGSGSYARQVEQDVLKPKHLIIGICIAVLGIITSFVQPFSLERVDAGHVAIKVNLTGDSRGISKYEYKTGWVILNDWTEKLYEFPTFQQTIEYPEQGIIMKGGFPGAIHPKFNYALIPGNIGDMFSNLRISLKEVEQGWLQTAIIGAINDVANRWVVDSIFNHREQFEADILLEANKRVGKWFVLSQLRTNIVPPKALQESIDKKTRAVQEAQAAEAQKLVADANAQTMIAEAKGDSAARVIRAAGEAEEMRKKQLVLTKEYLDYLRIQKWNGENSKVVTGGNSGVLMNLNQ